MCDCVLCNTYLTNNNMRMNHFEMINNRTVFSKDVMPCNVVDRCPSIFCDTCWRHQMPMIAGISLLYYRVPHPWGLLQYCTI
jgi:hypothetical protein